MAGTGKGNGMLTFAEELRRFGPAGQETLSLQEAEAYTRDLASAHYENFPVLSIFVPRHLRQHFANIYAYCRWSDDLADEVGDTAESLALLDWWEDQLHQTYRNQGSHPVMIALSDTIRTFEIPPEPFLDLLTAFRRDQTQTRYATFSDLLDYCRCSANPVGRLVLYLYRAHEPERMACSDQLCTGLQLANFWQDIAVDWNKGRVYLPLEDMDQFGVSEGDLRSPHAATSFRKLLQFEVERASGYLNRGLAVRDGLPLRLRIVLSLFGQGGLGILNAIRSVDYDVLNQRPRLTRPAMARVFLRAICDAARMPASRKKPGESAPMIKEGTLGSHQ